MIRRIAAALAISSMLAACSSSGGHAAGPTVTRTVTVTAGTSQSPVATPSSTTAPSASGLRLGQTYRGAFSGQAFTALVSTYKTNAAPSAPAPGGGQRWDGALVKVCVKIKSTLSNGPWSLIGADSGLYTPSSDIYQQFPEPQYPSGDQPVAAGQCVRGWIIFPVPTATRVVQVQYSLDSGSDALVIQWRV